MKIEMLKNYYMRELCEVGNVIKAEREIFVLKCRLGEKPFGGSEEDFDAELLVNRSWRARIQHVNSLEDMQEIIKDAGKCDYRDRTAARINDLTSMLYFADSAND